MALSTVHLFKTLTLGVNFYFFGKKVLQLQNGIYRDFNKHFRVLKQSEISIFVLAFWAP